MKIRPSLKLYFFAMMIMTGVVTISVMSVVSINYFFAGIDFSMSGAMRSHAYKQPVSNGNPVTINDFVVASQWDDLPASIKANLKEHELIEGDLLKHIDGNPLFAKPNAGYFVMKINRDGQVRYVSSMFTSEKNTTLTAGPPPEFLYIILIALVAIALFSLVPYFILRNVASPVEKLIAWATQLNKEQLSQPIPDFYYSELNGLATMVQSSLHSVQESLEREQRFLGYASHELRTPIAVTRTNTELLRKMMLKNISQEKQLQVLDRIERASFTMTDLTETLLWLNRQSNKFMPVKPVAIGLLSKQLLEELSYLLNGKMVEVTIETDETTHLLPEALCRIILTNLIRNALQHTSEGTVTIKQSGGCLMITNQNMTSSQTSDELGFGLGLELTARLVQHYGWQYQNVITSNGHYVEINFCSDANSTCEEALPA